MEYDVVRLNRLAGTQDPKAILGTDEKAHFQYSEVRKLAIDLLKNPKDDEANNRLSIIVNELGLTH